MTERPIIFSGPMVRAILEGRKTQSRRIIRPGRYAQAQCDWYGPHPGGGWWGCELRPGATEPDMPPLGETGFACPYGVSGDRLWVREAWRIKDWIADDGFVQVQYRADGYCRQDWLDVPDEGMFERLWVQSCDDCDAAGIEVSDDERYHWKPGQAPTRWRSPVHMPRWASRIALEMVDARVERLQEIDYEGIRAEGIEKRIEDVSLDLKERFTALWDSLNAKRGYRWQCWQLNPWVWVIGFRLLKEGK